MIGFIESLVVAPFPVTMMIIVFGLIVLDVITGFWSSFINGEMTSKATSRGLVKKGGFVFAVVFALLVDVLLSDGLPVFTTMTLLYIGGNEGLSIVENLAKGGVSLPKALTDKLSQLKDRGEHGEHEDK